MNLHDVGEFGLIERLHSRLQTRRGVRLGIGDDAAIMESLRAPVVTCDALVEKVHFRRDWTTPRALGRKAMSVNVSDIAAMGARPVAAFVALAVSENDELNWIEELYRGMEEIAARYGFTIAGGDTTRAPVAMISITLIGELEGEPVLRSGAQIGDEIIVTGTLGDAAAGLAWLQNPDANLEKPARDYLLLRHHEPTARLDQMRAALMVKCKDGTRAVRAALDLSDGIAGDGAHIAKRSNVSLEIFAAQLPISSQCRQAAEVLKTDARDWALGGGEDYELLLCVAPEKTEETCAAIGATGTPATRIGHCIARQESAVILVDTNDKRAAVRGAFVHF